MANVTINLPDAFVAEYNNLKATWDARTFVESSLWPMPPANVASLQRYVRDQMKWWMRAEVYRRDAEGPNDGSLIAAFEAAVAGV